MAWVLRCDRCEKIYSEKNEGYRRILLGCYKEGSEYKVKNKGFDLCQECMKQIVDFLGGL